MTSSPERLIARYHLTEEDVNKQITDEHIEVLSRKICGRGQWKSLPAHLGLATITAEDIDCGSVDPREKRHQFFLAWKQKKGSEATYKRLITALLKIECTQDAESVCETTKGEQQQQQQGKQLQGKRQRQKQSEASATSLNTTDMTGNASVSAKFSHVRTYTCPNSFLQCECCRHTYTSF